MNPSLTTTRRLGFWLVFVMFLFTMGLRLWIIHDFARTPYYQFIINVEGPDPNLFLRWADRIREGSWFLDAAASGRPFYISPFYPFLISLSLLYRSHPLALILGAQALISSALVFVYWDLGRRSGRVAAGILAALLWSLYGPSAYYDACLIRASLVASAGFLVVWSWVVLREHGRTLFAAFPLGCFLGFLTALRPHVFLAAIPMRIAISAVRRKRAQFAAAGLLTLCTALLVISPMTLHNWKSARKVIPVSSQGVDALLLGNDLWGPGVGFFPTDHSRYLKRESEDRLAEALRLIGGEILENPGLFADLYLRKLRMTFNAYEIPSNFSYYVFRRLVPQSRVAGLGFGILLALALPGTVLALRRRGPAREIAAFGWMILLSILPIHLQSRYRFPVTPFFVFLAGLFLESVFRNLFARRWLMPVAGIITALTIFGLTREAPSYGFLKATAPDGITRPLTSAIRRSDYITWLLALMLDEPTRHRNSVMELSAEAYGIFGTDFVAEFDRSVRRLRAEFASRPGVFRADYLRLHGFEA
ncbi:MAG: hypothetical protein HQL11_01045 [Candidatus Omnitrophica bacterium]|nr:hypothetical protein [Candidatus Omnitrophota bacterium]